MTALVTLWAGLCSPASAQSAIELAWNASTSPRIERYTVYYGSRSRTYTNAVAVDLVTRATVSGLTGGRTYYFAVTATDALGLESAFSQELAVPIPLADGQQPVADPVEMSLQSPADAVTLPAPATLPLAVNISSGAASVLRVRYFQGTTLIGESAAEPYGFNWANIGVGEYTVWASALLEDGSTVPTPSRTVTVLGKPTLTLTSPAAGASYVAPASIPIAASVVAQGNPIIKVRFYRGTTLLFEDHTAPYSYTWEGVSAGSHSISAQVVYGTGSTVSTSRRTITVGNGVPSITLTAPASGAAFAAPANLPLKATVSPNGATIARVRFYEGSTLLGEDTTSPYAFTWSGVEAGLYQLSAQVVYGAGKTLSTPAATVEVQTLPSPWRSLNIGSLDSAPVGTTQASGVFTVRGAGGLSGTADTFHFLHQPLSGDGQIQARLNSMDDTGTLARAGLMIRESTATGSRHVFLGLAQPGELRRLVRSSTRGDTVRATVETAAGKLVPPSVWLRLVRSGNTITASTSVNGVTWVPEGTSTITMASSALIGIAVASGSSTKVNRSIFSSIRVTP